MYKIHFGHKKFVFHIIHQFFVNILMHLVFFSLRKFNSKSHITTCSHRCFPPYLAGATTPVSTALERSPVVKLVGKLLLKFLKICSKNHLGPTNLTSLLYTFVVVYHGVVQVWHTADWVAGLKRWTQTEEVCQKETAMAAAAWHGAIVSVA